MPRVPVFTHERARQGRGGQAFYCPTVHGQVPSPCPLRHPQHGCPCADQIAQRAAVLERGAHLDGHVAERQARGEQRDKAIKLRARQQKMFG
jgi:hypothetical protein